VPPTASSATTAARATRPRVERVRRYFTTFVVADPE
jgi:hypothetical protein